MSHTQGRSRISGDELQGYRVLVVEDDYFVAVELCSTLRARGATVLGPAPTIAAGRNIASEQRPNCALLDVNLHGELAFDFAAELEARGVHTIFTSGYDPEFIPPQLRHTSYLQKPIDDHSLVRSIRKAPPRSMRE
jgi:DNA-binding response OmpR family regulator